MVWTGVWPLVIALALTTFVVICFPDGHLPSPRWRPVAAAIVAITVVCATLSALWPVEYASAGVTTTHPFATSTPDVVEQLWAAIAHPAYVAFQLLWVVALVVVAGAPPTVSYGGSWPGWSRPPRSRSPHSSSGSPSGVRRCRA